MLVSPPPISLPNQNYNANPIPPAPHPHTSTVQCSSAFPPNPVSSSGNAPVFVPQDGGHSWVLNAIAPLRRMTCDITHAMPPGENHPRGALHAGTLACAASITLD